MQFSSIRGQGRALRVIQAGLASGRLGQSLLFTGPDGVGKGMAARALATALVCEAEGAHAQPADACGQCRPCRKVEQLCHPDVVFVEPEGAGRKVRIDRVRSVTRSFRYPPFEGRHRAVVFPEAGRMNEEAANALLKKLEEPPERTIMVLVTASPQALLATIRSRCQVVRFAPLSRELCVELLVREGVAGADAAVAAALAEGSPGRALALVRSDLLADRHATIEALGSVSTDRPAALFELAAEWTAGPNAASSRSGLAARLDLLSSWYRDLLLASVGGSDADLVHADLAGNARASRLPASAAMRCLDRIGETRKALELNAGARLACERLLIRLAEASSAPVAAA